VSSFIARVTTCAWVVTSWVSSPENLISWVLDAAFLGNVGLPLASPTASDLHSLRVTESAWESLNSACACEYVCSVFLVCFVKYLVCLLQLSADALPYYTMSSLPPTSEQTYQCQVQSHWVIWFAGIIIDCSLFSLS